MSSIQKILGKAEQLIPTGLYIDPIKWKYLLRSIIRGNNVMLLGPSGSGKCLYKDTNLKLKVDDKLYKKIVELQNDKLKSK